MTGQRRRFSRQVKLEAIRLLDDGHSVTTVARKFGVDPSRLLAWKRTLAASSSGNVAAFASSEISEASEHTAVTPTIAKAHLHILLEVHNSQTGEIDAAAFARALNMPLATLAKILACDTAMIRNGDMPVEMRNRLNDLYRIVVELRNKLGSLEVARIWLHAPHPGLHKGTPLEYLRQHRIRPVVAAINAIG